ncbi:microtubule-associated protein RP/EB family member 3-like [Terrapene carolina triunguis]|uniref:microtubule-associated protein RP/EB family member 3-like n=1 Tax=Terrapene triunguis TaxID=2587831 RepID=UPI000E777DA9|nr:microtubule-associated protein RP/EB family member 3-like [Terrapene carolina triunguis]
MVCVCNPLASACLTRCPRAPHARGPHPAGEGRGSGSKLCLGGGAAPGPVLTSGCLGRLSPAPQRTSPTTPKTMPVPTRVTNIIPSNITRKNPPAARNGGSEADTQILELNQQLLDLKLTVDGLEKERDFYFSKLRDIELICQEHESENSPVISGIIGILYATEEGFAPPEDEEVEDQQPEDQDEY